ncbi:hypothetical protein O988_07822 [Pseudogymnoascus sp. VKM F-3808]|nr:hypothetical protein O988_07822 [Pseudogymnoascus sp. VKM F-3808]
MRPQLLAAVAGGRPSKKYSGDKKRERQQQSVWQQKISDEVPLIFSAQANGTRPDKSDSFPWLQKLLLRVAPSRDLAFILQRYKSPIFENSQKGGSRRSGGAVV